MTTNLFNPSCLFCLYIILQDEILESLAHARDQAANAAVAALIQVSLKTPCKVQDIRVRIFFFMSFKHQAP